MGMSKKNKQFAKYWCIDKFIASSSNRLRGMLRKVQSIFSFKKVVFNKLLKKALFMYKYSSAFSKYVCADSRTHAQK